MFTVGLDIDTRIYFASATMIIGIPTSVKVYSWLFSFWNTVYRLDTCLLFILGFISLFTIGGFTGILVANTILDIGFHDSYYVVGHFIMCYLGAVYGVLLVSFGYCTVLLGSLLMECVSKLVFFECSSWF